jgi:hypothetical protein
MNPNITRRMATIGLAVVATASASMATLSTAMADGLPDEQVGAARTKPSPPPLRNGPAEVAVGGTTKQTKSGTGSAAVTFWCRARAEDPRTLTPTSRTIYAEGVITSCGGKPTACHLGVNLEKYNGYTGVWYTMAHSPGKWKRCNGRLNAGYKCTHDPRIRWGCRTHIWLQVEKGTTISPLGQAYSANTKLFYCA